MMLAAETNKAPRASTLRGQRIVPPPWLGYPLLGCSPAEPNSVSPSNDNVHEEKNEATNFERRRYVHSQKIRPKNCEPPLDANGSFREVAPIRTDQLCHPAGNRGRSKLDEE